VSDTAQRSAGTLGPAGGPPAARNGLGSFLRRSGATFLQQREASVFVIAVLLVLYFGFISSAHTHFFSKLNLDNISQATAPTAIIAIGEVFLLVCGEIDLSVGFAWALSPFLMLYFITDYHVPVILAMVLAVACGLIIGWINGFVTIRLRVPSFITTLGTSFSTVSCSRHRRPRPRTSRRRRSASGTGSAPSPGRRSSGASCSS
jgi:simple sugar transport system permease protein